MAKLTAADRKEFAVMAQRFSEASAELRSRGEEYASAREAIAEWAQGHGDELESTYDERTEKWQDSDAGVAVRELIDGLHEHAQTLCDGASLSELLDEDEIAVNDLDALVAGQ